MTGSATAFAAPSQALQDYASTPFQAQSLDNKTLLFFRPRQTERGVEGFVVDSDALVSTLKSRVVTARGLEDVVQIAPLNGLNGRVSRGEPASKQSPKVGYYFERRLQEPFGSIALGLHIGPLADASERALVDRMLWLLGCSTVLGLYALYRMAKTQIEFAERSRNFVSAVSHELKTPLTAIRMYAEMLDEGLVPDGEKQQAYLRTITAESERLTRLIDNVLTLSRVERKRPLSLRRTDVRPFVREAGQVLLPHAQKHGFELNFAFAQRLPDVSFEPDALKQVVFNLVDNAIKYGKDGHEKRITVRCDSTEGGVVITVEDRGPGVNPSDLRRIFEPFYRGEVELTRKHQGTGIGLALVKGLVLAMGGKVSAENLAPGFAVHVALKRLPD